MKNRNKFLAASIGVTLAATAVVPTAFAATFSDTKGSSHEESIVALVEQGVISGYPDGTFKPNKTLTRSDVVKLVGKYLVKKGYTIPTDYKTNYRFTDVTTKTADEELLKYASMIKDNNILAGSNGLLFPKENMTREDMAIVLVKLIDSVEKVDLVAYEKGQSYTGDVLDLQEAKESARDYIRVLDYFDITNPTLDKFNPKTTTTRGQFATFLYRSIQLDLASVKEKPIEITEIQATGKNILTVKFNQEIKNTTSGNFLVKYGETTLEAIDVRYEKNTVQLSLPSKMVPGSYEVIITGLTESALSKTTTVEKEKVSKIEFPISSAILSSSGDKLKIPYKLLNQYGEDITSLTPNLQVSSEVVGIGSELTVRPDQGYVEITRTKTLPNFKLGDKVSIRLLDTDSAVSNMGVFTIAEKSKVTEISVSKLYNDVNHEAKLNVDANYTDFHLVMKAIDQYGLEMEPSDLSNEVQVMVSDKSIVDVQNSFSQLTIDGKKQTVLELKEPIAKKAGQAIVYITPRSSNKIAKYDIVVGEGVKADSVKLSHPSIMVAGEKTEVPFEVIGNDGKQILDAQILNSPKGIKVTATDPYVKTSIENDKETGKAKLILTDTSNATTDRQVLLSITTANIKSDSILLNIRAKAVPKKIIGLKDLSSNILVGGTNLLSASSLILEDQYGRSISIQSTDLAIASNLANTGKYSIKVESMDDKLTLSTNNIVNSSNNVLVTGVKKGSNPLRLTLQQVDSKGTLQVIGASSYETYVKVLDKTDIISYEMNKIDLLYDNPIAMTVTNYAKELNVYGVTATGERILIPKSEYTVIPGHIDLVYNNSNGSIFVRPNKDIVEKEDVKVPVKLIINADRQPVTLEQSITVTKLAPYAKSLSLEEKNGFNISDTYLQAPINMTTAAGLKSVLKITDQYGEDISNASTGRIILTVTNLVNSDGDKVVPTVHGNGTATITLTGLEAGDTFYITYVVDGSLLTTPVIVK